MEMNLRDTKAEIKRLQTLAEKQYRDEVNGVIERIKEAIAVYELSAADLGFGGATKRAAKKASRKAQAPKAAPLASTAGAPKYRDPDSGKTWTGRGRVPLWLQGKDRADFAVV